MNRSYSLIFIRWFLLCALLAITSSPNYAQLTQRGRQIQKDQAQPKLRSTYDVFTDLERATTKDEKERLQSELNLHIVLYQEAFEKADNLQEKTQMALILAAIFSEMGYFCDNSKLNLLINQNETQPQNALSVADRKGHSGEQTNHVQAVKYYRFAAEHGDPSAQYFLADYYLKGIGVSKDKAKAVEWLRKAAEKGDRLAQCTLGVLYRLGEGVPQDNIEAVKWYRKAAEQEHSTAQNDLGFMYTRGLGVEKNYEEALKLYKKSVAQNNDDAQEGMGELYANGWGVPQSDTEAVKWYRLSAENGNDDGQYQLGLCYRDGRGVAQDKTEAEKWLKKSAEQENADAQKALDELLKTK